MQPCRKYSKALEQTCQCDRRPSGFSKCLIGCFMVVSSVTACSCLALSNRHDNTEKARRRGSIERSRACVRRNRGRPMDKCFRVPSSIRTMSALFAEHSRQTFDAALDAYSRIGHEKFLPHNKECEAPDPTATQIRHAFHSTTEDHLLSVPGKVILHLDAQLLGKIREA